MRDRAKDLKSQEALKDEASRLLDDCQIIEFKPDTYSTSAAESQARQYLDDVRRKYKDDDRAKKCNQVDGYPFFRTVGVTYTACRS